MYTRLYGLQQLERSWCVIVSSTLLEWYAVTVIRNGIIFEHSKSGLNSLEEEGLHAVQLAEVEVSHYEIFRDDSAAEHLSAHTNMKLIVFLFFP